MFYDYAKIFVKAGKGGDGMVSFRREKYVPAGGPSGGDGGKGGSVVFVADEGLRTLVDFRYRKHYNAAPGEPGKSKNMHGAAGADLVVRVPVGTVVKKDDGSVVGDLVFHRQRLAVARGGRGGKGNARFVSSVNRAPRVADNGETGEESWLVLELKLLADVGLIGFPNVGKSSIIARVSAAKPKIADYPFTTIDPNLGVVRLDDEESFVLADIPGLIEGAGEGAGLGFRFLRHVERTRVLIHVLDVSGFEGRDPLEDFETITKELELYSPGLSSKPQIVAANKMDLPQAEENLARLREKLGGDHQIIAISAATGLGCAELMREAGRLLKEQDAIQARLPEPAPGDGDIRVTRLEAADGPPIAVRRDNDRWILSGSEAERQIRRTNFHNEAAVGRLLKILRSMDVDGTLKAAGAADGDTVVIGPMEFEYADTSAGG
ncbi:MAG: GTPase ObgE [Clostridiales bacterium]|nr:GTPase ObgE [Clostridiales bacterium]